MKSKICLSWRPLISATLRVHHIYHGSQINQRAYSSKLSSKAEIKYYENRCDNTRRFAYQMRGTISQTVSVFWPVGAG